METKFFSEENGISLIVLSGILLMFLMGIVLLLFFYFSKKKIVQKELEKKNLEIIHQKDLLEASLETKEKEQKRIARDLHDDISSKLNIVSLNCDLLSMGNLTKNEQNEAIEIIVGLSAKALENSRRIAHGLFPPVLDEFGLDAGLEELCSEFKSNGVAINYQNRAIFKNFEKTRHLHVFRIVQELMNNSLRHGKATKIDLLFENEGEKTRCEYRDNGKGFDPQNNDQKKGLGIKNIQSRVNFLNGELVIDSKISEGTKVIFNF
ncbi:MAG TPA: sensor histidine kinase [Flavobacteriaceae bacterium]|nr:sensor histidine kinase [Flavobacteriaceae bacterium]